MDFDTSTPADTHDLNGNLTSDGVFQYQYDNANQLTNVVRLADGVRVLSARYDALGRRVEATRADGSVERYVCFPGSFLVLAVLDGTNAVKEVYTRGPDLSGSLDGANTMVADGSITNNPVFCYPGTQMDNRNATQDDIWFALAEYVPAISSPVGGNRIWSTAGKDINLNGNSAQGIPRPNGWGRDHNVYGESWLPSDMKNMAFFYIYKLYEQLVTKGTLQ